MFEQVSAGFDAHMLDPLEQLSYQSGTYYTLVSAVMSLSDELCGEFFSPAAFLCRLQYAARQRS